MPKELLKTFLQNKALLTLLFVGSLSWYFTMCKSGLPTAWGIGFWGANGHDGIWHLALSNSFSKLQLENPVFAGTLIGNYHIGFDLTLGLLSKIGIPNSVLYFQVLPLIFSVAIGLLSYQLARKLTTKSGALWSLFFVYFGGSFGWIVTLVRGQGYGGESMFWSQQAVSTLINPPFALSLILILIYMLSMHATYTNPSRYSRAFVIISGVTLSLVKIYGYLIILGSGVLVLAYLFISRNRNSFFRLFPYVLTGIVISATLFFIINPNSSGFIELSPFWFLETMLSISDRFYWPRLYEAIVNWKAAGIYHKAFVGYSLASLIFILGNFGTRIYLLKNLLSLRKLSFLEGMLYLSILISLAPVFLFVQKGTPWNTIQFMYYGLFFSGLIMGKLINKSKIFLKLLLVFFTLPTTISTLSQVYLPARPPAVLPYQELEALNALKNLPDGIVLTYPFDKQKAIEAQSNPPRPLYLYESTAYVSAFSNKTVFLEDEVNLNILDISWQQRKQQIDNFYQTTKSSEGFSFLRENNIKYIYWVKPQRAKVGDKQLGLKQVFENKSVYIYEVVD